MVTKGIITSIDFNGNTCQVRIPLFETAGNDPITGTAIVSNTPGSYNGYKVGDVVLVAFEDGKMQNPVIVGKLYLGAAKEKQDPRGTINVETTTASKSASLPADAILTANVDSNVPNTNTPFGSLASIANNLNSLNTDVNQLDRFTRNQFNSVITDVNDQGEQLRSEIKQTAGNIEAKVDKKHDSTTTSLGWNLTDTKWTIDAQDTVNGVVKDINIVTIDRNGMSIAGDLKLNGYPKNIIVRYAQNGSDKDYPYLYKFKQVDFPDARIDKTWYYNKYIKIIEADKEKYILISSENIDNYTITPGETVAYVYNLKEINTEWKTETPARVDGQYIWQWTHTESFSFNGDNWNEQDDDKVVCITGAKGDAGKDGAPGKNGADGKDGYTTVTVMLYKRSKTSLSDNPISSGLYYKFSDQKLYTDDTCTTEYTLPEGWSYTSSGTGDSSNGDLYCIAAVAHSNTDFDSISASEWVGPTSYVENGVSGASVAQLILYQRAASIPNNPTKDGTWTYNAADGSLTCDNETTDWKTSIPSGTDPCYESHAAVLVAGLGTTTVTTWSSPAKFVENGEPGIGITSLKTYYLLQDPILDKPNEPDPNKEVSSDSKWKETPDVYIDGYVYWLTTQTIYSDGRISYSDPVKDNGLDGVYEIAQGKSKNYYGDVDPAGDETAKAKMHKGDGWFDTAHHKIGKPTTSTGYLQKYIKEPNTEKYILITSQNIAEYISGSDPVKWPDAYSGPTLYQWSDNGKAGQWKDVGGKLIANKVTANYINALDITAKKITVLQDNSKKLNDSNPILFQADGTSNNSGVKIGGFTVDSNRLYAGTPGTSNSIELVSSRKLIAYKSNNQGVESSYAVSKITVNKATDLLTVYIRSYAESNFDYIMISKPNVSSYPTSYSSSDVKAHTSSKQNSSSALAGYTEVNYYNLKQNDYIYIVYRKDGSGNSGTDTGYLLIPETTDISIEAVDNTDYTFERDTSLDTKEAWASLKVGSNFSVDSTGALKSTSGTIGGFEVTNDDLHTANKTIGAPDSLFLSSTGITNRLGIGGSSGDQTWSITAGRNFGVTKSGTVYANDMMITAGATDIIRIGTNWAGMYFQNIYSSTGRNDCYVRANEIKNTGRFGYNIAFADSEDQQYSASISIRADKPAISGPFQEAHYDWKQGIELETYNPADNEGSGALANNAALRIGYYSSQGPLLPAKANKARGFLGDVWCPTGIFRCKNGNIVPYIYGYKSGLLDTYSDEFEYGFYFESDRLGKDSWASWYYGDTFTGIDCVIVSMGLDTGYGDTKPGSLSGSKANENSFYFIDHINKYVYWCNDTGNTWTVDVFIVGYKQRAAGTFIGEQEIK